MSARASAYAKSLVICPNGDRISRGEKLVLIVLADNHQDKATHFTYPSIETIAEDALCDRRSCQRHLAALEFKGVIRRMRPPKQGRGTTIFYFFTALDAIPEGWQDAALLDRDFFVLKGGKRAAEGRQKGDKPCAASMKNINQEPELRTAPPTPSPSEGAAREAIARAAAVEHAVDAGMRGCGFALTARRLRKVLKAVIDQQTAGESDPLTTADAMIAAWKKYTSQDAKLRVKFSARRFFEEGYWLDVRSWHWDGERLREMRREREAGAGMR